MTINKLAANALIDIIESAGYESRSYSGRGMYGAECVGFTVEGEIAGAIGELMMDAISREDDELVALLVKCLHSARTDSMGRGTIVYFPIVKMEEGK